MPSQVTRSRRLPERGQDHPGPCQPERWGGEDHHRDQPGRRAGQGRLVGAGDRHRSPVQRHEWAQGRAGAAGNRAGRGPAAIRVGCRDGGAEAFHCPAGVAKPGRRRWPSASNRQRAAAAAARFNGELAEFDFLVFLDRPPRSASLPARRLGASAEIYIPIQCEYLAMEGLSQIIELGRGRPSARGQPPKLEIGGIVS